MTNAIIIHGTYGHPEENWFPWLKTQLEALDIAVAIPRLPTPEGQSLTGWRQAFEPYQKLITKDTILIGHSLGPAFIFDILAQIPIQVQATFLVAPFTGRLGHPTLDKLNESIANGDFDWPHIKSKSRQFYCYYSNNDPYVSQDKSELIAHKLQATARLIPQAGHLNDSTGFQTFDLLLKDIKQYR